jgi:hypothetical protein
MINFVFSTYKCNAAHRGLEWGLNKERFEELLQGNCHYCGALPRERIKKAYKGNREIKTTCNGIDRKDSSQGYTESNVVSCCYDCQWAKNDTPYGEFLTHVLKMAHHIVEQGLYGN